MNGSGEDGSMAVEEDSDLGRGASGNEATEGLASERESAVRSAEGGVKETGVADESADKAEQQKRAMAESNKTHLSVAVREWDLMGATLRTLLYQGTGVTGPLVTFCVVL
jgi:hypothetical protein